MKRLPQAYSDLRTRLNELARLSSTIGLLTWDQETMMPERAAAQRAETQAYLSGLYHRKILDLDSSGLLSSLAKKARSGALSPREAAVVREVSRDVEHAAKLPEKFVEEYAEVTSRAQHEWAHARKESSFARFKPWLEKVVTLTRQKAEYLGGGNKPYDTLLDEYEPGMSADELSITFEELKNSLVPLVEAIQRAKRGKRVAKVFQGTFPLEKQKAFTERLAGELGFDLSAGRIDVSAHPFSVGFHPGDVRITTRYDEKDPWYAIGSTIHEVGHALYEQGLPHAEYGTPLGEAVSLGVHESQSRFWENMVGKSRAAWKHFFPLLKKQFPEGLKGVSLDDFYRHINTVSPSLIRTESDEVTYNLHIILRFEIEKELIEGSIAVKDVPHVWNEKMREYLGVKVPDDARGVLQDVHWSGGGIAYFPTYTLGNLYSAQIYDAIRRDIADFKKRLENGDFAPIREWLRRKIHQHGRRYPASELMRRATGSKLAVAPFISYLKEKYEDLYRI